jgi:hypothetical protein
MNSLLAYQHTAPMAEDLGPFHTAPNIQSSLGPFRALTNRIRYPEVVVQALIQLYQEYNHAFKGLVQSGMEWPTDYRYCNPANFVVQMDMVALPQPLLDELAHRPFPEVVEFLRLRLFEIENSVAMYQLLERICYPDEQSSFLKPRWRATLDGVRHRTGLPIALLAVTDEKYWAMAASEFGMPEGVRPTADQVRELSGFDAFYGPDEFMQLVAARGEDIGTLLYVRASDPPAKLRKPGLVVEHPLLANPDYRRIIRAHTVTVNIDNPAGDRSYWINDAKSYAPEIGLGYAISTWDDLLEPAFGEYLALHNIELTSVHEGQVMLRGKPLVASYGAYGHVRGLMTARSFRTDLRLGLRQRPGGYLIQPEMTVPVILNTATGIEAGAIDRVWVGLIGNDPGMLGAFRNYMPTNTVEFQRGRIHGNDGAFWSAIVPS